MDLSSLELGQALCERDVVVTSDRAALYIDAVEDDSPLYAAQGLAPPMAVAAIVMAAAMEAVELPAGAVHTGQELAFAGPAPIGASVRCVASVAANSVRRGTRFLSLDLTGSAEGERVVEGRASLAIAEEGE